MEDLGLSHQFKSVYKNKRVLVTGHTGFKGSWLCTWLLQLGAEVYGISKDIPTSPSSMFEDICLQENMRDVRLDIRDLNQVLMK
jgi:CDP-glucose 4,6-dehydratase